MNLPPLPRSRKSLKIQTLTWFGAIALSASSFGQSPEQKTDPLKELVDTLPSAQPAPASEWIPVLVQQPKSTTSDIWLLLEEEQKGVALTAYEKVLKDMSRILAEEHLRQPYPSEQWRPRVRVSIDILHTIGTAQQLKDTCTLLRVGETAESAAPQGYSLSFETRPFQNALNRALGRDSEAWEVLYSQYGKADFQVARAMLRALGDSELPQSANTLGKWLGQRPKLDAILLTQIARCLRNPHIRIEEAYLAPIRRLTNQGHATVRQAAIRVLGFADDVVSIKPLIQVLQDPNLALHEESLRALHRITAMTLDGHPDRWRFWFEEETQWWRQKAPATLAAIRGAHPTQIAEVLRELGSKRLFRREIAPLLLPLLKDSRPEVVRMSLAAMDSLRPPLEIVEHSVTALLDHRHAQVRKDAQRVLLYLGADLTKALATIESLQDSLNASLPRPK